MFRFFNERGCIVDVTQCHFAEEIVIIKRTSVDFCEDDFVA